MVTLMYHSSIAQFNIITIYKDQIITLSIEIIDLLIKIYLLLKEEKIIE